MSRNAKIALIVVGSLVVVCLGVCAVGFILLPRITEGIVSTTPGGAGDVGAQIADYTVPPGYKQEMGMNLLVYQMVFLAPEAGADEGMLIMLMGTRTPGVSRAQMEEQMQQSFQQQFNRGASPMQVVGEENYTIRGQDTTFTITESQDSPQVRQEIGTFDGENGLVLVMAMGAPETWDATLLRNFLESIQ